MLFKLLMVVNGRERTRLMSEFPSCILALSTPTTSKLSPSMRICSPRALRPEKSFSFASEPSTATRACCSCSSPV